MERLSSFCACKDCRSAVEEVAALRAALEQAISYLRVIEMNTDRQEDERHNLVMELNEALAGSREQQQLDESFKALMTYEPEPDLPTDNDIDPELRHE